jgi:hypothetical protein
MKKIVFTSILILPLSSVLSDEVGPHRKTHKIGKNTVVLEKINPPTVAQNRELVTLPVTNENDLTKVETFQKHECLGIKAVTYPNGLSRVEWWPLGIGSKNSSSAVSNIN